VARSRDKNPDENLRGHLRQLKSENKNLRRQVTRLEKQLARQPIESIEDEDNTPELPDSWNSSEIPNRCPKCGKEAQVIDLVIKKVLSCKNCNYRSALKK